MADALSPAELERMRHQLAAEFTRSVARWWWAEAQKVAEQIDDPPARWEILLTAMRRVGWPE